MYDMYECMYGGFDDEKSTVHVMLLEMLLELISGNAKHGKCLTEGEFVKSCWKNEAWIYKYHLAVSWHPAAVIPAVS